MVRDCKALAAFVCEEIGKRVDTAVVGLSGGADSSLVAILSARALGRDNVYGVSMPYNEVDVRTFNARSTRLAERLGIRHLVRPVAAIADAITAQMAVDQSDVLTAANKGNARSRARMCVLYGLAHALGTRLPGRRVRVMGTGNLSEDFIGYDTKGGDALADLFPIGELFKSEVYQMLGYFVAQGVIGEDLIDRIPSAGLEENQTDEGDLGHSYNAMEHGVRFCLAHYRDMPAEAPDAITAFVWERHLAHRHKHEAPPVVRLRHLCD
ncbi:MAG: NAD(+) synthase [Lentisphaerae bacterium]|nr:NAD(+) synthase [Lentisphaerota bacterium]